MKSDKELLAQIRETTDYAKKLANKKESKIGRVLIILFIAVITNMVAYIISAEFYSNNQWVIFIFSVAIGVYLNVVLGSNRE